MIPRYCLMHVYRRFSINFKNDQKTINFIAEYCGGHRVMFTWDAQQTLNYVEVLRDIIFPRIYRRMDHLKML